MKSLVCQAQHLELNPLLYGQPMKLLKDWGDMFISPSIGYYSIGSILCSLNALKLALCNTIQDVDNCKAFSETKGRVHIFITYCT